MNKITLSAPVGGPVVSVPLTQSKAIIISGTFEAENADNVSVTVRVDHQISPASVDTTMDTFQAAITLSSPSIVGVKAILHTQEWVSPPDKHGYWKNENIDSNIVTITVQDLSPDPQFLIRCRCVDSGGRPLMGMQIDAFDQDPKSPDDKLGDTTTTNLDGFAEIRFRRSDFTEHSGEQYPDIYFKISRGGKAYSYKLPGEKNDHGVLRNFIPRASPVIIHIHDLYGYEVKGAIRDKWLRLGAYNGFLGFPVTDELPTPDGRGRYNHFEGGSIYWTPVWGAFEVHGLIRRKWAESGWERGFLGFPVTDELPLPGDKGGRYSLFEHGIITWEPGQMEAVVGPHHYERIYAEIRAQILSRHFAVGSHGRRNLLSLENYLIGPVNVSPVTKEEKEEAERARWRIDWNNGENPHLYGSFLNIALAIEHNAGNEESGNALEASLATLETLFTWKEPGAETTSRLPQRWDAGLPIKFGSEAEQFLSGCNGSYSLALSASNIHHYVKRSPSTLQNLMGSKWAETYTEKQGEYSGRFRDSEFSMDELTGLVTSYWIINKLSRSSSLSETACRQASYLGNYLANHGYILVRPMRGVAWHGSMGVLPALEFPFSRALGAITGDNYSSRTDFRGAMIKAGYWNLLEGPIANAKLIAGLNLQLLLLPLGPLDPLLGLKVAGLQALLAGQVLSHDTLASAYGVFARRDCFDCNEDDETFTAPLFSGAADKPGLYQGLATIQAMFADYEKWSVNFHAWIGLTGVDDPDSTVRQSFSEWFRERQSRPQLEPKGLGSRMLFSAGVATLVMNDTHAEERLVALLEQAMVELYRNCYFEPKLPIAGACEKCGFDHKEYKDDSSTPYGPLDLMVATALAFWHARRRADAGNPVSTPRFPQPLSANSFASWPKAAIPAYCLSALQDVGISIQDVLPKPTETNIDPGRGPIKPYPIPTPGFGDEVSDSYGLFDPPVPPRRPIPRPTAWEVADRLLCDTVIPVRADYPGDVATGITLFQGHEFEITADGDIWAGVPLDSRNGPEGLPRLIYDARWPLHTGIDPSANAFCLLGRLNGYFRIGSALPHTCWVYRDEKPLFLRVNDDRPGDGNGQFNVHIQVWGPASFDPSKVYRPINILRDGGILRTSDRRDWIEVTVVKEKVESNAVEFELITPDQITWRKEIVIGYAPETGGSVTVANHDSIHQAANGLYLNELPGATLTFRKEMGFPSGVQPVLTLGGLDTTDPGSRITFNWYLD